MKYYIYCRKSTESEDRQILSLGAQKRELTEFAEKNNLNVVSILSESASAYTQGRKKFGEMVRGIQEGKADGIIVWAYNRLARNSLDGGMIIHLLDIGDLKEIRTPTSITNGSGNNKFMLQLEFAMSKKSSDDNSESVKRGNKEKILRGWDIRKHPGYMFVEDPNYNWEKVLHPDPERFQLIKDSFGLVLKGKSVRNTLDILNNKWGYRTPKTRRQGGKPMTLSNLYRVLQDDFYCGWIYTPDGQKIKGKHKQMIREDEFNYIQQILADKRKPRPKYLELPYRSQIFCGECGCTVCMEEKIQTICSECKNKFSSRNKKHCPKCNTKISNMSHPKHFRYVYGRCTKKKRHIKCSQKTIRLESLEKQLTYFLDSIEISPRVHEWIIKRLQEKNMSFLNKNKQVNKNHESNLKRKQNELDSLFSRFVSPENTNYALISAQEYQVKRNKLSKEKTKIESMIDDSKEQRSSFMNDQVEAFNISAKAKQEFENGDYKKKTAIIQSLGSNLVLKDRKIRIEQEYPWLYFRKAKQTLIDLKTSGLEPEKMIDKYEKTGLLNPVISCLQAH
jgi:site-specific DNA recombinase